MLQKVDSAERKRLEALYDGLRLKLLDLSRRNQLLNYNLRPRSKRFLQVVGGSLEDAYSRLVADEGSLRIAALPEPDAIPADERTEEFRAALERAMTADVEYLTELEAMQATGRDDEAALAKVERRLRDRVRGQLELPALKGKKEINRVEHAKTLGIDPNVELDPKGKMKGKELQTLKYPDELESALDKIAADSKLAEQEMGLSTLFLAFGFLEWYDSETSDKKSFAPLLLLPVQITKTKEGRPVYSVSVREGEAEANLSLQKLLEQKQGRTIPDFRAGEEDQVTSVESYLETVRKAVKDLPRWQVRRWLVLGHFSFGRFAMYADLDPQNWSDHTSSPLVASILKGTEQGSGDGGLPGIPDDYDIDRPDVERVAPFLIHDADASQHSALIDVMRGENLVVQGPPGTGKSQTITNVIANALAAGKRVLFLAEKAAALRVVKNRLDRAGLGEFCLELHSDKASPKLVVQAIRSRYEVPPCREKKQQPDPTWVRSRDEISAYVKILNATDDGGETPFDSIWRAIRGRSRTEDVAAAMKSLTLPIDLLFDEMRKSEVLDDLGLYASASHNFEISHGHPARSPWNRVPFSDFPPYDAPRLLDALLELRTHAVTTLATVRTYSDVGVEDLPSLERAATVARQLPELPAFDFERIVHIDLGDFQRALEIRAELLNAEEEAANLSDLKHVKLDRLALASMHPRKIAGMEVENEIPREAYAKASSELKLLRELVLVLEQMLEIAPSFGFGTDLPVAHLPALATAAYVLGLSPANVRPWIIALPDVALSDFVTLIPRWASLSQAERDWKAKASGYRADMRPKPADLLSAARELRRTGLTKIVAAIRGKVEAARANAALLGIAPEPEALETLAAHVTAVSAFETDSSLSALFGSSWAGLDTAMDDAREGLRMRDLMLEKISALPGGSEVARAAISMSPEKMAALAPFHDACKAAFSMSQGLRQRLTLEPAEAFVLSTGKKIQDLEKFLAIDPGCTLADIESPFRRIAYAYTVRLREQRLAAELASHATGSSALSIAPDAKELARTREAVAWVHAVRSARLQPGVERRLLSSCASEVVGQLRRAADDWENIRSRREAVLASLSEFGSAQLNELELDEAIALVDCLGGREDELPDFVTLRSLRSRLHADGLAAFLEVCDRLEVDSSRLKEVLEAMLDDRKAAAIRRSEALRPFTGTTLEGRRATFREKDKAKILQDREVVRSRLLQARAPLGSDYGPRRTWTDMRLLGNEFTKQKRFIPVRQLLDRAGNAIQCLHPCIMMSPLSLAKFVPAGSLHFDLLVIDEASQMRPEDALGGLLRADQIVVVGDAKQLPPTDFFARGDVAPDEEVEDDLEAESILEACEKTFGLRRRLKWHYRSRCESLIAFSNSQFYENGLITFPMARPGSFSIELVRVDGHYQGQRNPAEARRVAEEAVAFMRHHAEAPKGELASLGIVAINVQQRELIEEELRLLAANDELVEKYTSKVKAAGEEFFVKNLENVQGDERDHIFISMTYGKKAGEPSMSQNFGPINRSQGHRRLNVLFTRARIRIGLFTSFGSPDVQVKEGKPGVNALHAYLLYAESQGRAVAHAPTGIPDSDFEVEVADRLRARGYRVDLQVGISRKEQRSKNFRIDLAVHHPDMTGHYLAGVECDGATYHSSKSARDRDRLREEVLNSLGWQLVRVWSTDWFDDPVRETDKLVLKLEQLRKKPISLVTPYPPLLRESPTESPVHMSALESQAAPSEAAGCVEVTARVTSQQRSGEELLNGQDILSPADAVLALEAMRDRVIVPAMDNWEPERSLLRPAMIETFVKQRITDPDEWALKVPMYLRQGTNPIEKKRFLDQVCEIVERVT